jgi:phasin family protein
MKPMKTDSRRRPARRKPNVERKTMETMNIYDVATGPALKRQLESGLAVLEAITESSRKLQQTQLKAATEAHAAVEAMHKRVAQAADGQELWRLQSEWMSASMEKSLAYWRELYQTAIETETSIAKLLAAQLPFAMPVVPGAGNGGAGPLAEMMNDAYKRWTEAARQFSKVPEEKA